jgi:AraC-like DNA-binding protein
MPFSEPAYRDDYRIVFGRVPVFDTEGAAFTLDSALLDAPVVRDERDLAGYLRDSPADLFATRDYASTPADQVHKILERGLRGPWPAPEQIAARLRVSPQHLRRLLREQGTSITAIKEEILRDAAITSLVQGTEPVDHLAARLGFSEASAFRRAFRRWTGSPPGAYRGKNSRGLV